LSVLTLRPAREDDMETLAVLNRQLLDDEGHPSSASVSELTIRHREWLRTGEWAQDILEVDGHVVGYLVHAPNPYPLDPKIPERFIRQFCIDRAYRRNGLGRDAFELFMELRLPPGGRVTLDVLESNPAGQAFWTSVGCRPFFHRMEAFRPAD
jgi:GNAT superfamily N-acetyltransferase